MVVGEQTDRRSGENAPDVERVRGLEAAALQQRCGDEPVLWPVGAGGGYGQVDGVQVRALRRADVVVIELEGHVIEGEWPAEELAQVRALRRGGHTWPRAELVAWRRISAPQGTRFREHLEIPLRDVFLPPSELAPLAQATAELVVTLGASRVTLTLADDGLKTMPEDDA